jgi:hypothetical protein
MAIWPAHRPPTKRSYNSGSQIVEPLGVELGFQGFEEVCVMADLYVCHHIISLTCDWLLPVAPSSWAATGVIMCLPVLSGLFIEP